MCLEMIRSSIGKKVIMAITGVLLLGFVVGHLAGNLLIFLGPDALNAYAKKLRDMGPLLWVARIGLLTLIIAHIGTAIQLTLENRKARPIPYSYKTTIETTYAARTMMVSGFIVLGYIIYHLMHFTFKVTHPEISHLTDASGLHDVYSMVVLSFQELPIAFIYIVSIALLSLHLSHGLSSLFQSLGLMQENCIPHIKKAGYLIAALIFIGYASIPAGVLAGIIKPISGVAS